MTTSTDAPDPTPKDGKGADPKSETVRLLQINLDHIMLPIHGTSPLIMHKWSEKAIKTMLDKQQGKASKGKEPKDPEKDYLASMYHMQDDEGKDIESRYGFPSVGFKAAAVRAGVYCDQKMTFLRGAFHVDGELVEIFGAPRMREDPVRISTTSDIRHRAEFPKWRALVPITFNRNAITKEQIVNLFRIAGFSVGVGEWRPERDGQYGRFDVVPAEGEST